MRILFLSTWFPYPFDNGSKLRAFYLLSALARAHEVTMLSFDRSTNATPENVRYLETRNIAVHAVPTDPHQYVKRMPSVVRFASPIPLAFWPDRKMQEAIDRVAQPAFWDVVVAFQTSAARYATQIPAKTRILDVDTALSWWLYDDYKGATGSVARGRRWISLFKALCYETPIFRRFDHCTIVSTVELEHMRRMLRGSHTEVVLIPNGVDCDHNCMGLAQPQPRSLVYNGSLTYSANYDAMRWFLADIYPRIRAQIPDVSLTITGSTNGVDMAGLALDAAVRFTGFVDDVRLPVAGAMTCVVPIRQGGGTRLKILEAMALGTPVVTTTKGAEGLDVTDGQQVLIADDPDLFTRHVVGLLSDPDLHARLAANARSLVEARYDWASISRRFIALVEDSASRRRTKSV